MHRARLHTVLARGALLGLFAVAARPASAATIVINNVDGPGEGFNDPTMVGAVGGNPGTTIGAQRLNACTYAADIWASLLTSPVTIRVDAKFNPQQCDDDGAILGSAGAAEAFADFPGAPLAMTFYPSAIADKHAGADQSPGIPDIVATFNSNVGSGGGCPFTFYYGLDGNAGDDIDLVSVALHELAHGLGFNTLLAADGGAPYSDGFDDHYAHWLEDHTLGLTMPDLTKTERRDAQRNTGNLHFVGPLVKAASGLLTAGAVGDHVRMYAPGSYQPGSSVAHWDTVLVPDQLMEPAYTGPNHDPSLSLPLLCDVGWAPCACGDGTLDPAEGCDDGNAMPNDGCSATCQVEECWTCAGEPSVCSHLGSGTPCDDGNGCTQTDECDGAGTCVGSDPISCTALDQCHDAGVCDPQTGQCSNPPAANGTPCDDGDACTNPDACNAGACLGPPQCIDSFLCYKAKTANGGGPFVPPAPQTLFDEFNEVVDFNVVKPKYLCTPAEKNGTPQVDAATHLEGYKIKAVKDSPKHVKRTSITVVNQLDSPLNVIVVDTVKPDFLLVPTAKSLVSDPPPPGTGIEVDHYKCYKIKVTKGTPKFPKGVSVTLADQFIATAQTFSVLKPTHLCTPVDKEGEGIEHDNIYQLCYKVKRTVENPPRLGLFTHNQFGAEILDATKEQRLCVPSVTSTSTTPVSGLIHNYELNGTYADSLGGPPLDPNGGTLGPNGYTFAAGQGPSLSGVVPSSHYSIEMGFYIDVTSGFKKLVDFKDLTSDYGLYDLTGALNFYPVVTGPSGAFSPSVPVTLLLTRNGGDGEIRAYVDGGLQLSFFDSGNIATFTGTNNIAHFFRDDTVTSVENSSGFLDFVRIYDQPITP